MTLNQISLKGPLVFFKLLLINVHCSNQVLKKVIFICTYIVVFMTLQTAESVFSHFRCKYEYTKIRKFENTCDGPRWGCFAKKLK